MKHKLRCIGRLVRIRNGKLVTQRKVWAEVDVPFMVHTVRRFRKPIASLYADPKALERWQQRKWNEPSELKVHYI